MLGVLQSSGPTIGEQGAAAAWSDDTTSWHYLAVVWNTGITSVAQGVVYLDGVSQTITRTGSWTPNVAASPHVDIGTICGAEGTQSWQGAMVEHRISNIARSAGWIGTTYNTGFSPSTFYSIGLLGPRATLVIDDGPGLTDRTDYIAFGQHEQLDFNLVTQQRGTASIALEIRGSDSYMPTIGSLTYLSDLNAPLCVFAGTIDTVEVNYFSNEGDRYVIITLTDFLQSLDTIRPAAKTYFGQTAGDIVTDLFANLPPTFPFNLGTISAGITIDVYAVDPSKTIADYLTDLANASGYVWGIDYSKSIGGASAPLLYFTTPGAVGSPLTLVTTMLLWETVKFTENRANYINTEIVQVSMSAFTALTDADISPNGIKTVFTLPWPAYQVIAAGVSTSIQSTQTGTFTGVPANNDTVTLDGRVYTWKTTLDNTQKDQLSIGATADDSAANLAAAINADPAVKGTAYSYPTWHHNTISASVVSATITVAVMIPGAAGNGVTLSESTANFTWASSTTANGADGSTQALSVGVAGGNAASGLTYTTGSDTVICAIAPASGTTLVIAYQRLGDDFITCQDSASVAARSAAEGGTGIYSHYDSDTSETNPDLALTTAQAVIANFDVLPDTLEYQTDTAGWVLGQEVPTALVNPAGISTLVSGNWLIYAVKGTIAIEYDPTLQYLGFRYTIQIVNTSVIANHIQFFQNLANKPSTALAPNSPNAGAGAGQSGTQFETFILSANGTVASAGVLNSQGITLIVTATQDGTGGWNFAFDPGSFSVDPTHIVNPAANSSTQWTFLGNGTIFVEQAYKQL